MNEFEWRRQLRGLRQPLAPQHDLWGSIDTALDDDEPIHVPAIPERQPGYRRLWLVAASLAAAMLLVSGIGWRVLHAPAVPIASVSPTSPANWKPADPRLAGAAIELDAARMELRQAIQQAPDSPALQRLLARTEHQQMQLRQLAHEAG